ncbi:MAG: DUF3570 domain-containing protein [Gammaproteobacteria bacterium]|nr:DUF3570 domain-containing protein [Gammaproteobacteria bacterium]
MQLTNIKSKIGLATCSLLQVVAPTTQAALTDWKTDAAILYYGENNGRVSAIEPAIHTGANINDDNRVDIRLVFDALTGATPNGAHATSVAQTFSTPSGNDSYTTKPGKTPLDSTFHDTRFAVAADWTISLDRLSNLILGVNVSTEFDYLSTGVSSTYARDFNNRNTTLTAGLSFNYDTISPEGDVPTELAAMVTQGAALNRNGSSDTKTLSDIIIGITQVVNRKTLVQLNYTFGYTDGYQNDPYKIVTVIDPATGLPATASGSAFFDTASTSNLPYVYEKRPNTRQRNALFLKGIYHLTEDIFDISYRYFWDDWGIRSNTLEMKYRYQLGSSYLQPLVRYYTQTAADFYTHDLSLGSDVNATTGEVSVNHASNDYRLAKSVTSTVGLKYGMPVMANSELSVRGEYIKQNVNNSGIPAGEGTPDLDAVVLQLNYSLAW